MKKKHRDIVVDGLKYGWTVDGSQHVKIWYDKKVIAEYDVPYVYDVTPSIVAGLIGDPKNTLLWIHAEPCPFCGKLVEKSQDSRYLICVHEEDCWMHGGLDSTTLIIKHQVDKWNKRH